MVGISGSRAAERAHIFRKGRMKDRGRREGREGEREMRREKKEREGRGSENKGREKGIGEKGSRRTKDNLIHQHLS